MIGSGPHLRSPLPGLVRVCRAMSPALAGSSAGRGQLRYVFCVECLPHLLPAAPRRPPMVWFPLPTPLLLSTKSCLLQDPIPFLALDRPLPVLTNEQAARVLLRTLLDHHAHMEFTDHLVHSFVVVVEAVDLLHSKGGVGQRIVFCGFKRTQLEFGTGLVVLDLADQIFLLHAAKRRTAKVRGHHVQTVSPVTAYV